MNYISQERRAENDVACPYCHIRWEHHMEPYCASYIRPVVEQQRLLADLRFFLDKQSQGQAA